MPGNGSLHFVWRSRATTLKVRALDDGATSAQRRPMARAANLDSEDFTFEHERIPFEGPNQPARETLTVKRKVDGAIAFRKTWIDGVGGIHPVDALHADYDAEDAKALLNWWGQNLRDSP